MNDDSRKTGIEVIGEAPWGVHLCQFYQTKQDLVDILVPYFKAGLENNEFCMWVVSDPLEASEAERALRDALPDLDRYLQAQQIEIIPHTRWYLNSGEDFDQESVVAGWISKLEEARQRGFEGLRLTGNTSWLPKAGWRDFIQYEDTVHSHIKDHQMMAMCTYPLDNCDASQVTEVVSHHDLTMIKLDGKWTAVESSSHRQARESAHEMLEKLRARTLELENANEELAVANEELVAVNDELQAIEEELREEMARRAEAEEKASRLAAIVESSEDAIIGKTLDGTITSWNRGAEKIYGYSADEVIGQPISFLISPGRTDEVPGILKKIARGETISHYETERITKDGSRVYVSLAISSVRNRTGEIVGASTIARDVSSRRQGEDAIARLAGIVRFSEDAIIGKTLDGIITSWNNSAERMYGYLSEEVIGRHISLLTPPDHRDEIPGILGRIGRGEAVEHFETERMRKDGTQVQVSLAISPIKDAGGKVVGASTIARDVTDRKKAEEELQNAHKLLQERAEELATANEELLTMNEEIQAGSEEIEAVNEELRVTNEELHREISERKRAQQELDLARGEAERRAAELQSFYSSLAEGLGLFDTECRIVSLNEAGRGILGLSPGESPGDWLQGYPRFSIDGRPIAPEDLPVVRSLRTGEVIHRERMWMANSAGMEIVFDVSSAPVRDNQGRIIGAAIVFRDATEQAEFERRQQELYEHEHRIAEILQQAIIPKVACDQVDCDIAVRYQPALEEAQVGGDFYDVFALADARIGVVIGDVAGKGLPAARRVAAARYSIRSYAYVEPSPARAMALANEALCKEVTEGSGMLTAFFAIVDTREGTITYANAGHEPPVIHTAGGEVLELEVTGPALGILGGMDYSDAVHSLGCGDMVVMLTDGITEARRDGNTLFEKDGVLSFLALSRNCSASDIAEGLLEAAKAYAGGSLQDDAAILVLEHKP